MSIIDETLARGVRMEGARAKWIVIPFPVRARSSMSLIGIDIGSSSVKTVVYDLRGKPLAEASEVYMPKRPQPGWWELNPEEVWSATLKSLSKVAGTRTARSDPPEMMAISASGREAFPVDKNGKALGPCIMAGDTRGAELEAQTASQATREEWYSSCGHIPERMDPVNRLLWWQRQHPDVMNRSRFFLGWHEFITLRLAGRPVTDRSLASKWCVYEFEGKWSAQRLAKLDIDPRILPEIAAWGTDIGRLRPSLAARLGLPKTLGIAVGCFDAACAALGTGASPEGVAGLVSGTWEDLIVPTTKLPPIEIVDSGFWVGPHPGSAGLAVLGLSPNGTVVVDWARSLMGISLPKLKRILEDGGPQPSPVLAVPHFSGATVSWPGGRKSKGGLLGLSLASSETDIIQSLMESIAYDLLAMVQGVRPCGVKMSKLRAAGGGTRSAWWTQLKADLTGLPIEVVEQSESGTVGAALLAGLASGAYASLEEGSKTFLRVSRRYEPDAKRAALYAEKLEAYRAAVSVLLHQTDWQARPGAGGFN